MLADVYRRQRSSVVDLVTGSGVTGLEPVPCCPGWSVADVVRHLLGVVDSWLTGDLEVYASAQWTSDHVASWSARSLDQLIDEWQTRGERFAALIDHLDDAAHLPDAVTTVQGPVPTRAFGRAVIVDLTQHLYDVASALRRQPSIVDEDALALTYRELTGAVHGHWKRRGHEPFSVVSDEDGEPVIVGGRETATSLSASRLDLIRSMGGRRTIDQIRALRWHPAAPPADVIRDIVVGYFDVPAEIVEPSGG